MKTVTLTYFIIGLAIYLLCCLWRPESFKFYRWNTIVKGFLFVVIFWPIALFILYEIRKEKRRNTVTLTAEQIIRLVVLNHDEYHVDNSVSGWLDELFPELEWPDYKETYYKALQERREMNE